VVPLNDGKPLDDRLCRFPVITRSGCVLPKCMDMITAEDVIEAVEDYLQYSSFAQRAIDLDFGNGAGSPAPAIDDAGSCEPAARSISSLER
jgi:hypothetical protein